MHYKFNSAVIVTALLLFCAISTTVFSQITITSPVPSAVYQRDIKGQRAVTISGTFTVPVDKIEARAVPVIAGQGIETPWKDLAVAPVGGVFSGEITLYGGWYTVEVRGTKNGNVVGRSVLQRLGVGEVFIIAGQSNAQGLKKYPGPSAVDDRVIYISNYDNDSRDLLTDPPAPTFAKITSDIKTMSPRGQTAWCWGILGDLLVAKHNVPVLFINTAWEGTAIENWSYSSRGIPTENKYGGFIYPPEMPYANLRIAARNYGNQYGVRAILWMQGEADALFNTPAAFYRDNLQFLMNKLGADTGGKRITWVIARTSRTSPDDKTPNKVNPQIIAAQNAVLDINFYPTWPGPETDPLDPVRAVDYTHFIGTTALTILANAWYESLNPSFFSTATPIAPAPVPSVSATCVTENNAVSISLPTGYASYLWNTGETTSTIRVSSAGTYRATVKDKDGNSMLSSVVVLNNSAKPTQPTIIPQGQQQACADSSFTFSIAEGNDIYSWYKAGSSTFITDGPSVKIDMTGSYEVQGQNIFGCVSDKSSPVSLIVRPEIPKPIIESSGPFSASARIEQTGLNEEFLWHRPGFEADTIADMIKILKTGTYTARTKVVYTLDNQSLTCYSDTSLRDFRTNDNNEIVIYPNPSLGSYIYVESRDNIQDASITLYDIFGRVLQTTPPRLLNSRLQLNVAHLPTGKYILKVTGKNESLTKQIIIR